MNLIHLKLYLISFAATLLLFDAHRFQFSLVCQPSQFHYILEKLQEEMSTLDVYVMKGQSGEFLLENKGSLTYKEIEQRVQNLAIVVGANIKIITNPNNLPIFEEVLQTDLNKSKEV